MAINNIFFLKIIIISLILTPSLDFIPGVPSLRLDDILVFFWLFIAIFYFKYNFSFLFKTRILFIIILAVYFLIPVLNGLINGFQGDFADLNQYIRFIKYIGFYCISYKVFADNDELKKEEILGFFVSCGVVLFFITLSQYFNFLGLNDLYVRAIAPTQYETLVNNSLYPRPVGMVGNPNELGYLMALLSLVSLYCAVKYKSNKYYIFLVMFALGCLMTLSRGAMVALIAGFLAFVFIYYFKASAKNRLKILIMTVSVLIGSYFLINNDVFYDKILWRFEIGLDVSGEDALGSRFDNWDENINIIKAHPIIGVGPLRRAEFQHAADNEWLLILRSYGIFGALLIISIFLRGVFSSRSIENRALLYALILSSFLYMIPAVIFHSLILFPLVLFVFTVIDSRSDEYYYDRSNK